MTIPAQDAQTDLKLRLLLVEYETLRQEILDRIKTRAQLLAVAVAAFGFMLARDFQVTTLIAVTAMACLLTITWWRSGYLIRRCADRVTEIEKSVNHICGEEIMVWETRYGGRGWFDRVYRRTPSLIAK
jgi:hypothetical protein